jgi:hypothetical protein
MGPLLIGIAVVLCAAFLIAQFLSGELAEDE